MDLNELKEMAATMREMNAGEMSKTFTNLSGHNHPLDGMHVRLTLRTEPFDDEKVERLVELARDWLASRKERDFNAFQKQLERFE